MSSHPKAMKRMTSCSTTDVKDLGLVRWSQTRSGRVGETEGEKDVAVPGRQSWGDAWLRH